MNKLTSKQPSRQVIMGIVIVFVFLAGIIFSLGSYFNNTGNVAGETDVAPEVQMSSEYNDEFNELFRNYLVLNSDEEMLTDEFLSKTSSIKTSLLSMRVPGSLRGIHLETILLLTDIEGGVKSQDIGIILSGVYQLRDIIVNF